MESWQISLGFGIVTYIALFVTVRNKTDQHTKEIEKIQTAKKETNKKNEGLVEKIFEKLDEINAEVAEHKVRLGTAPNMEQVRAEFVSKEMFKQMQKHIDEKFDRLENGIDKILSKLENR